MRVAAKIAMLLIVMCFAATLNAQQAAVIISLSDQTAYLLENGQVAFASPIASGKEGWGTPRGNFQVVRKDLNHVSGDFGLIADSYGRIVNADATPSSHVPAGCHYIPAPMPYYMQFGRYLGMHAGFLPGYPGSHGCVRMPRDLAADFFARVQVGTPVEVIGNARNVTRVRRAIPLVQPGDSAYGGAKRHG